MQRIHYLRTFLSEAKIRGECTFFEVDGRECGRLHEDDLLVLVDCGDHPFVPHFAANVQFAFGQLRM